ncbi:XRE family transcriptional regulator [Enterobacter sp. WCHEn045836]|uniref:helix-turn-helix domain-containing protein n=1 Tax=Enterobacter sp. WCHEn045836 TaxID=2497434 RepID=UPI000F81B516|nr:helix-turn-helix transcriptional regulator [Enterobacter sp. WCHEn045836]RTQ01272.1 XRE family transcriptional regulator [Enterobacter sp. WCHEn045836]
MKLNEFLKKSNMRQADFAVLAGVSQARVSRAVAGIQPVRGRIARKWAEITNWQVTPHELCPEDYPNPTDGLPPEIQFTILNGEQLNHENHPND